MRDESARLRDVLEAVERIERYTSQGREVFEREELVQIWVVHHIQIIGESLGNISDELRGRHPEIPWVQIIAMRNILIHEYFGVNLKEVWYTVEHDLPDLKRKVEAILQELAGNPDNDIPANTP
jgi:uncharacterized protein with HEPN domain